MSMIIWLLQIIFIPVLSPLGIGLVKKIKAKMQNRQGASILQPYRDLWKLFHKDEIISSDASWIFRVAPFIIFAVTIIVGASIPLFGSFLGNYFISDILLIVYTLAIGTFFIALAGMDTGGAFGGFGSSREMTVSALAEGGLIFSLLTVAFHSGSTNLFKISDRVISSYDFSFLPIILAFLGFFIVLLAENGRFPFDNPATHLELTMIHEAMIIEYSGKRLALMEWAAANKLLIFGALAVNLFFSAGIAHSTGLMAIALGIIVLLAKVAVVFIAIAVLESTIAKFRFFRLPDILFISFILNIAAIALLV
ncbi:formate hydrogenlyase [Candidatus Falkowbacteria bacterium CG10_big_fil_rev_8_21_14_0_10_39_9]|uniref:Formate hydrogenlyase n=1 Tax=Candidatus Falkowbacteria bacterium CG10_big_fil_rev_8_21_14_0_10_39_9 TaxID=1974566 RepID=A0A2M6WPI1_9BACT|nr:MAG: formate hydrogenlyase [Candidatus Falkowbacteria bacterium CG10_big_fil_rev_8_21_14_0_10_39_9]